MNYFEITSHLYEGKHSQREKSLSFTQKDKRVRGRGYVMFINYVDLYLTVLSMRVNDVNIAQLRNILTASMDKMLE